VSARPDRPDRAAIDSAFGAALGRLRLTSEVGVREAPVRRGAPPAGGRPVGSRRTIADELAAAYRLASSDLTRRFLLAAAKAELKAATTAPPPPAAFLERGGRAWQQRVAMAEGSLRAVAEEFGVSHEQVRRLRQRFRPGERYLVTHT
jgi:hypothetical protein